MSLRSKRHLDRLSHFVELAVVHNTQTDKHTHTHTQTTLHATPMRREQGMRPHNNTIIVNNLIIKRMQNKTALSRTHTSATPQ